MTYILSTHLCQPPSITWTIPTVSTICVKNHLKQSGSSFCVARVPCVALGHINLRFLGSRGTFGTCGRRRGTFAGQAWHKAETFTVVPLCRCGSLWQWEVRLDWIFQRGCGGTFRGKGLGDICFDFSWQASRLWHWLARLDRINRGWRRSTLRGRRGARYSPLLRHFAWQALHLEIFTFIFAWQEWRWGKDKVRTHRLSLPFYDTFCSYPPPLSFFLPVSAAKFSAPFWKKSNYWVIESAIFVSVSHFLVLSLPRLFHYLSYHFCHTPFT